MTRIPSSLLALALLPVVAFASEIADWPTWRHDAMRSGGDGARLARPIVAALDAESGEAGAGVRLSFPAVRGPIVRAGGRGRTGVCALEYRGFGHGVRFGRRGTGCNRFLGSDLLVTFRSALACFLDLNTQQRTYLSSMRSGCTNSILPAAALPCGWRCAARGRGARSIRAMPRLPAVNTPAV